MYEIVHVILTVNIASPAIIVGGVFDLVLKHRLAGLEVLEAVFISALDLACHVVIE